LGSIRVPGVVRTRRMVSFGCPLRDRGGIETFLAWTGPMRTNVSTGSFAAIKNGARYRLGRFWSVESEHVSWMGNSTRFTRRKWWRAPP
jgi:hypothetical protein